MNKPMKMRGLAQRNDVIYNKITFKGSHFISIYDKPKKIRRHSTNIKIGLLIKCN